MHALRTFLNRHLLAAAALIALAMAMRLLVPSGVMPTTEHGRIVVALCSGSGPATVAIPVDEDGGDESHDNKAGAPCAFAALGTPTLASVDPILLVAAIAFAMLLVSRAVVPLASVPLRLRPPLRGPPTTA